MAATIAPRRTRGVLDTGGMLRTDLNADLGESAVPLATDETILTCVTSANIACGFHAGNRTVMAATIARAADRGVTIGAHVSYRDRAGFGRRPVVVGRARLVADVVRQITDLAELADRHGATVRYVKAHGALYHAMNADDETTGAVLDAMAHCDRRLGLLAQAGSPVLATAHRAGVVAVPEAFPDRGYASSTTLLNRSETGAVIDDPEVVAARAVELILTGGLQAADGSRLPIDARSLCIHGDGPRAVEAALATRRALEQAGITVSPAFVGDDGVDDGGDDGGEHPGTVEPPGATGRPRP
jgi:UPF0271 protein